jgi:hypothetical protein
VGMPDGDDAGMETSKTVGVLLVRAWLHDRSLVARVTRTSDIDTAAPVTIVVSTPRQLHREVARWLHELGVSTSEDPDWQDG